jgi:hypothetical protein
MARPLEGGCSRRTEAEASLIGAGNHLVAAERKITYEFVVHVRMSVQYGEPRIHQLRGSDMQNEARMLWAS